MLFHLYGGVRTSNVPMFSVAYERAGQASGSFSRVVYGRAGSVNASVPFIAYRKALFASAYIGSISHEMTRSSNSHIDYEVGVPAGYM